MCVQFIIMYLSVMIKLEVVKLSHVNKELIIYWWEIFDQKIVHILLTNAQSCVELQSGCLNIYNNYVEKSSNLPVQQLFKNKLYLVIFSTVISSHFMFFLQTYTMASSYWLVFCLINTYLKISNHYFSTYL